MQGSTEKTSAAEAGEVTRLLEAWSRGDCQAAEQVMPLVFAELRRLAGCYLNKERPDHTLQPTALVNEAFLRLVEGCEKNWVDRRHFFAVAAKIMRRILVDHARHRSYKKRGGGQPTVRVSDLGDLAVESPPDLLALDEALHELATFDAKKASIVELRFFVGLNLQEIAEVLGCSTATVTRHWLATKAWLYRAMIPEGGSV
ncbi:MAG: sigma-70 family RNA polymerase sigma factor [Acidobacteriota bacterium]